MQTLAEFKIENANPGAYTFDLKSLDSSLEEETARRKIKFLCVCVFFWFLFAIKKQFILKIFFIMFMLEIPWLRTL